MDDNIGLSLPSDHSVLLIGGNHFGKLALCHFAAPKLHALQDLLLTLPELFFQQNHSRLSGSVAIGPGYPRGRREQVGVPGKAHVERRLFEKAIAAQVRRQNVFSLVQVVQMRL